MPAFNRTIDADTRIRLTTKMAIAAVGIRNATKPSQVKEHTIRLDLLGEIVTDVLCNTGTPWAVVGTVNAAYDEHLAAAGALPPVTSKHRPVWFHGLRVAIDERLQAVFP